MLILYRKNKQSGMEKEEGVGEIKQSGMVNRKRVKRFKHSGIVKGKVLWRGITGLKH